MKMHPMFPFTIKSNVSIETECTEDNRPEAILTVTLLPELHVNFKPWRGKALKCTSFRFLGPSHSIPVVPSVRDPRT